MFPERELGEWAIGSSSHCINRSLYHWVTIVNRQNGQFTHRVDAFAPFGGFFFGDREATIPE